MLGIKHFIKTSIIGGLLVISPAVILFLAFRWAFNTIAHFIQPLATPLAQQIHAPSFIIDLIVLILILAGCFVVGNIVTTSAGKWLHARFDNTLSRLAPGYNLVKDIIHQFFGDKTTSPFANGEVARVKLFGCDVDTSCTAIVTSRHDNGWFTVFVPTGPNPTSGMMYHLPPDQVELYPTLKVDEALRTIIACGAGSGELFANQYPATK